MTENKVAAVMDLVDVADSIDVADPTAVADSAVVANSAVVSTTAIVVDPDDKTLWNLDRLLNQEYSVDFKVGFVGCADNLVKDCVFDFSTLSDYQIFVLAFEKAKIVLQAHWKKVCDGNIVKLRDFIASSLTENTVNVRNELAKKNFKYVLPGPRKPSVPKVERPIEERLAPYTADEAKLLELNAVLEKLGFKPLEKK